MAYVNWGSACYYEPMNENFTATPAPVSAKVNARHANLVDLARRGFSIVGYVTATEMAFGSASVSAVTVMRHGNIDRVASVLHRNGRLTTFMSHDGEWHDSKGFRLDKRDAGILDDDATWLVGGEA